MRNIGVINWNEKQMDNIRILHRSQRATLPGNEASFRVENYVRRRLGYKGVRHIFSLGMGQIRRSVNQRMEGKT